MKRARTLICVDSEFTNPNIAAVRLRLDGTGIPKVGRERGEEIDVEKKRGKKRLGARWKREPKNRPTSANLPNSHALWVSNVLEGFGGRKSADSVVSSRVVPSLLPLSILLQQSSSATSSLGISNGDHVPPQ